MIDLDINNGTFIGTVISFVLTIIFLELNEDRRLLARPGDRYYVPAYLEWLAALLVCIPVVIFMTWWWTIMFEGV